MIALSAGSGPSIEGDATHRIVRLSAGNDNARIDMNAAGTALVVSGTLGGSALASTGFTGDVADACASSTVIGADGRHEVGILGFGSFIEALKVKSERISVPAAGSIGATAAPWASVTFEAAERESGTSPIVLEANDVAADIVVAGRVHAFGLGVVASIGLNATGVNVDDSIAVPLDASSWIPGR